MKATLPPTCLECSHPLEFIAWMGAPGVGQSWQCPECGRSYVKIGSTLTDVAHVDQDREPHWILDPMETV